jgi:hypothetical protein
LKWVSGLNTANMYESDRINQKTAITLMVIFQSVPIARRIKPFGVFIFSQILVKDLSVLVLSLRVNRAFPWDFIITHNSIKKQIIYHS